ncbi:hypothetical protein MMC08_009094, partial [Hypocenomyce scalaris]|nr:hypothetical protein [Hypocenomyce scalaris]
MTKTTTVQGKTAIVTGAGSGINLAFAKLLLAKGCNVIIADITLRSESQAVLDLHSSTTPKAVFQKTDVTEWVQLEKLIAVAEEHFGGFDIVCPGAGVGEPAFSNFWYPPGSSETVDTQIGNHYKTLDINLTHPIRLTQLAIAHFLKHKKPGNVILITSIAGQISFLMTPMCCISKAGISSLTRSLAPLDPRHSIRVNCILPGLTKTPIWLENPSMLSMVDETKDSWITPSSVAQRMLELIESDEHPGGTVLEVGAEGYVRKVGMLMDPGP